jgi:hypothetical protein
MERSRPKLSSVLRSTGPVAALTFRSDGAYARRLHQDPGFSSVWRLTLKITPECSSTTRPKKRRRFGDLIELASENDVRIMQPRLSAALAGGVQLPF